VDTVVQVLLAAIGTALVDAMTGDAWQTVKTRVVSLWHRYREGGRPARPPRRGRAVPLAARPRRRRRPPRPPVRPRIPCSRAGHRHRRRRPAPPRLR